MYSVAFFSDSDKGACHKYRVLHPVEALQKLGIRAEFRHNWEPECQNFDAFFFQRSTTREALSILYQLRKKSCPVVYDIDDDIFHIPEHNPVHGLYLNEPKIPWHQVQGLVLSSRVSVSCSCLKELYSHFNEIVTILPNCVREDDWKDVHPILVPSDAVRVFWGGSPTHKNDLEIIIPAVYELKRQYKDKIEFVIMGQEIDFGCQVTNIPAGDYNFFQRVMTSCDIGLAPMEDNFFNRGKSDLRLKELGCARLAAVASPVGEYDIPFVDKATKPMEWVSTIKNLIDNIDYRCAQAEKLHDWAYQFLMKDHIHKWDEMFKEMIGESPSRGVSQGFTVHSRQRSPIEVGGSRVRVGESTSSR